MQLGSFCKKCVFLAQSELKSVKKSTILIANEKHEVRFPSGQRGRTVNPLANAFAGSNPALTTSLRSSGTSTGPASSSLKAKHRLKEENIRGNSSIGRAAAFQAVGCGFESRFPLQPSLPSWKAWISVAWTHNVKKVAGVAQSVEQLICNQQVAGSNPVASSKSQGCIFLFFV